MRAPALCNSPSLPMRTTINISLALSRIAGAPQLRERRQQDLWPAVGGELWLALALAPPANPARNHEQPVCVCVCVCDLLAEGRHARPDNRRARARRCLGCVTAQVRARRWRGRKEVGRRKWKELAVRTISLVARVSPACACNWSARAANSNWEQIFAALAST